MLILPLLIFDVVIRCELITLHEAAHSCRTGRLAVPQNEGLIVLAKPQGAQGEGEGNGGGAGAGGGGLAAIQQQPAANHEAAREGSSAAEESESEGSEEEDDQDGGTLGQVTSNAAAPGQAPVSLLSQHEQIGGGHCKA